MFGIIIAVLLLGVLIALVSSTTPGDRTMMRLMIGGYLLRMGLSLVIRDIPFFSHGTGGDYLLYEEYGWLISRLWDTSGFTFVTATELPEMGPTSLPPNLFALIIYANGDKTALGCTALVAFAACLTIINMYHLALSLGADQKKALVVSAVVLFSPAYLFHTCDMFKDGLVIFFTTAAFASAVRLSQRPSIVHAVIGVVSLIALWYVRYYLLFVTTAPVLVGLLGPRSKSPLRPLVASLTLGAGFLLLASTTHVFDSVTNEATSAFELGTSAAVRSGNADGGSGVVIDDGGNPWAAMGPKLIYTLLSPFPWETGSMGLQIAKLDVAIWYFLLYRAAIAARRLWKRDRTLLVMILVFTLPTTVMYATHFSNMGLNLRQRMPVVLVTALLALLSWPRRDENVVEQTVPAKPAARRPLLRA